MSLVKMPDGAYVNANLVSMIYWLDGEIILEMSNFEDNTFCVDPAKCSGFRSGVNNDYPGLIDHIANQINDALRAQKQKGGEV